MPRKGVPYGGAICSFKERIAELFDLVGEKLHSINGVQGDGQGNVQIESGDDAIVITNDQIGHKIELSLDNSKLPAAAVSNVNGQTGAVVLDAGNIPTRGNANVQTDIDAGKAGLQNCIANINTEREARQNADAALQANINAVQGRMTTAEGKITAIEGREPDYVKKSGAAQTVTSQIMVPTTATGTRDTQIANGTRIQNDLDNYAGMIRTTGNQVKAGTLELTNPLISSPGGWHPCRTTTDTPIDEITLFAKLLSPDRGSYIDIEFTQSSNTAICFGLLSIHNEATPAAGWIINKHFGQNSPLTADAIVIAMDSDGAAWLGCRRKAPYGRLIARVVKSVIYGRIENTPSPRIEWLNATIAIGTGEGYTIVEAIE